MAGWLPGWLALGGWLIGSGLLALAGWLTLAGWPTLAGWLWLAGWLARFDWLTLSGWLAGWLPACPTTYMPASCLTCLLITSETLWVHLVYGVKFCGFNRCHSKCLRNKNTLETCKSPRPGQHQVGVSLQSHAQHQLWISTWCIFHEFHKIMQV